MKNNNIFNFATKELSQDAFLCWIANWHNFDSPLAKLSESLISLILSRSKYKDIKIDSIEVFRQYKKIDILILVNKKIAIIIEDKTNSTEHDAQISKYEKYIKENGIKISPAINLNITDVICVYYKTAEYIFEDERILCDDSIVKISRHDMLNLMQPYTSYSEIINDYYTYLKDIDDKYSSLLSEYSKYNHKNALQHSYLQYKFIFDCFSEGENKKILSKHASIPEQEPVVQQGTTYGWPYTWYWILEFSKNISEENRRELGRYLGFRIDNNNNGPYIAFKMYCKYDKNNLQEKELQNNEYIKIQNSLEHIFPLHTSVKIHKKNYKAADNYECEFFRCYFDENVYDDDSYNNFTRFLRTIANIFDLFSPMF